MWYNAFEAAQYITEDIPLSRQPLNSSIDQNIKKLKEILFENHYAGVGQLAEDLEISSEYIRLILVNFLNIRRLWLIRHVHKMFSFCIFV